MKEFGNYQYIGGEMSKRDKQEEGSKFWNKGKWDNFVLPFLPKSCKEMTLVDMGCNAGLFLKLAEDKGFSKVIGVDANREAFGKALAYREKNGGKYDIQRRYMERSIDYLPVSDFTILANSHYYLLVEPWLRYLDELQVKTRYCIIVTAQKNRVLCKASAAPDDIRSYFKNWDEVKTIEVSSKDDPFPRQLWGLCFKSRFIDRIKIDTLDNGNRQQRGFFRDLDKGISPIKTEYYRRLKKYRRKSWPVDRLIKYMHKRVELYKSVKKNGLLKPIIVGHENRIVDGNHRCAIMKHLGYKTIFVRKV